MVLDIQDLYLTLGEKKILEGVSLCASQAKLHVILGANGAGKTSFLKLLCGLLPLSHGSLFLDTNDLATLPQKEKTKLIAYMPQFASAPPLSVKEFLALGRRKFSGFSLSKKDQEVIQEVVEELALEGFLEQNLSTLSGGERQKIYLAQALIQEPKILLLDEPISHLDPKNQVEILEIVKEQTHKKKIITLMVLHDLQNALHYADEITLFEPTKVLGSYNPQEITEEMIENIYKIACKIFWREGHPFVYFGHSHKALSKEHSHI